MPAIIPIPAFADNYIWLLREGSFAAVVDPGDAAPVQAYLDGEGLELVAILATHHHGDHVGGVRQLVGRWRVPVFGPAHESIPSCTRPLSEGDSITLPRIGCRFSVLDIPGHTSGHIAYAGDGVLFCGDTMFAAGCGRLFEGTPGQMVASLDKLVALEEGTGVYCGHEYTLANLKFARAVEPDSVVLKAREAREMAKRERGLPTLPSTIADERITNPFVRAHENGIRVAAERHAGRTLADRVAVFAELRAWKNAF